MSKETGGSAFPTSKDICANEQGMTLRDYFAGQLVSSIMGANTRTPQTPEMIAKVAYMTADAMIAERNK